MSHLLEAGILQQAGNVGETPPVEPTYWGVSITTAAPDDQFVFYIDSGTSINIDVDWGDGGAVENITTQGEKSHMYATAGNYLIEFSGSGTDLQFAFSYAETVRAYATPLMITAIDVIGSLPLVAFAQTFRGCENITSLPANLFRFCGDVYNFNQTFSGCTGLTAIPSGLFRYNNVLSGSETLFFYATFYGCTGILTAPAALFRYVTRVGSRGYEETFAYCSSLRMRADLWGSNMQAHFDGRTVGFQDFLLRTPNASANDGIAPALWDLTNVTFTGTGAFGGTDSATTLSNYADIPAGWL